MISPVTQRQIFQTANLEATRLAHEVSGQLQREDAARKAAEDRMVEEEAEVHQVTRADRLRAEERNGRQGRGNPGGRPEEHSEGSSDGAEGAASGPHVDLLA